MSTDVKMTEPKVEERPEQHYLAIRTQVGMSDFGEQIPLLTDEVYAWLNQHGVVPAGPPFVCYHVIDMPGKLDVEMGVPVADAMAGNGRVMAGVMPTGSYASLIYTGVENGIAGNGALLDWGAAQGLTWDRWDDPKGDAFGGRVEYFLDGPEDHPDPATWDTEVAIRLAN
jgi:effector-binding domain-containing protein